MISLIANNNFAYISLHAEQSYREFPLVNFVNKADDEKIDLGIFCNELKNSVIQNLINDYDYILMFCKKKGLDTLIIDCNYINSIQINQNSEMNKFLKEILDNKIDIIVVNCTLNLVQNFQGANKSNILDNNEDNMIIGFSNDNKEEIKVKINNIKKSNVSDVINQIREKAFEEIIQECCEDNIQKELCSSQVYTDKYIDIKKCIESIQCFPFMIYTLARKLIDSGFITEELIRFRKLSLFCHTLNGSYIASLLGYLLGIDILFYDHIGPKNKLYRTYLENKIQKDINYIVVADVICLGSELRSVRTLLEYEGAKFKVAASIVNIATTTNVRIKRQVCSVIEISKDYNPFLYHVYTDLGVNEGGSCDEK